MAKLFAMEDADLGGEVVEMEAPVEVGEVADVETEATPEVQEIVEVEGGVEEGAAAADQLEQVEQVVETASEGEGLTPVAAEAIRIAVEAICARVGANPKAVYSLYATENFVSSTSRKANTKYALEGVGEFLKDLWKKIKAALSSLWAKVQAFWDKHISSLGRVKKALESMKAKVAASTGKFKEKAYLEQAPGYIAEAFVAKGDISPAIIKSYIDAHKNSTLTQSEFAQVIADKNKEAEANSKLNTANVQQKLLNKDFDKTYELGTQSEPMVGGVYKTIKLQANKEDGTMSIETEEDRISSEDKGGVTLAEKGVLSGMISETLNIINDSVKNKEKMNQLKESYTKLANGLETAVNKIDNLPQEEVRKLRKALSAVYKINAKAPTVISTLTIFNVKLAKAVLGYSGLCLKHYAAKQ